MKKYNSKVSEEVNCPNCSTPNDKYAGECAYCGNPLEFTGVFNYE